MYKLFTPVLWSVICFSLHPIVWGQAPAAEGFGIKRLVSPESVGAIVVHPQALLQEKSMELFPHEVLEAFGQEQLGISLKQAVDVVLVIEPPQNNRPPQFGMAIRFDQPQTFRGMFEEGTTKEEIDGETYYSFGLKDARTAIRFRGDRLMYVGSIDRIAQFDRQQDHDSGPLQSLIDRYPAVKVFQIYMAVEPVRELMVSSLPPKNQFPAPLQGWLEAPELTDHVYLQVDTSDGFEVQTRIGATDARAAKKLRRLQAQSTQMAKAGVLMQIANQLESVSPGMQEAINVYAQRVMDFVEKESKPEVVGNELVYTVAPGSGTYQVATIGILTGMLLPAVQQVRFAARRTHSMNNLRQLALSALNYEAVNRHYPRHAIYSDDGKPLLSWRVAMLPYLEENDLYRQFHLDEPWDSPHNIKLIGKMPAYYESPLVGNLGGKTVYQCFTGEDTMFPVGAKKRVGFGSMIDGSSNTILFVESDESAAVEWTKPSDLTFTPEQDVTGVGNAMPDGFNVALADGSTHMVSKRVSQKTLKELIMRNDGQVVNVNDH